MDDIDRANQHAEQSLNIALNNHLESVLQQKINSGDTCVDCDALIESERRKILPHCLRCIDCQAAHELEKRTT